jgi:hypothetical protein
MQGARIDNSAEVYSTLQNASRRRRRLARLKKVLLGVLAAVLFGSLAVWAGHGLVTDHWGKFPWKAFQLLNLVNLLGVAATVKSEEREALRTAAQLDDISLVGPLAEALEFTDRRLNKEMPTRAIAEEALIRLLPRLQASDGHLLDEEQRQVLYRALDADNRELVHAILAALTQVGGVSAIAPVTKLTSSTLPSVRDSASQCLQAVSQRVERQKMAAQLLRPSQGAEPDLLLRPAADRNGTVDSDQLLRAAVHSDS